MPSCTRSIALKSVYFERGHSRRVVSEAWAPDTYASIRYIASGGIHWYWQRFHTDFVDRGNESAMAGRIVRDIGCWTCSCSAIRDTGGGQGTRWRECCGKSMGGDVYVFVRSCPETNLIGMKHWRVLRLPLPVML